MGIWTQVDMRAVPFTEEAKARLLALDFRQYEIAGFTPRIFNQNTFESSNIIKDFQSADTIMNCIAESLGNEGIAYLIVSCTEDIPYKNTYYYLCDDVRFIDTDTEKRNIFLRKRVHEVFMQMDQNDISALYSEVFPKKTKPLKFEDILLALEDHFSSAEYISIKRVQARSRNKGEKAQSFIQKLAAYAKANKIEIKSEGPSLEWEEKGLVTFTDKERASLLAADELINSYTVKKEIKECPPRTAFMTFDWPENASIECMDNLYSGITNLTDALELSKKESARYYTSYMDDDPDETFAYAFDHLDRNADIEFMNRHFAITGFEDRYEDSDGFDKVIEDIERRGGILHRKMVKMADYLVVCVGTPHKSMVRDALMWREKGAANCIISDYQLLQALKNTPPLSEEQLNQLFTERDMAMKQKTEKSKKTKK